MMQSIAFGPYRLDPDGQLYRGDEPVRLQPRPLAVLRYLAARRGTVVRRDELIAKVWEGTAVTRAVLKVAVRAVREALGDDAESPLYIETVGREGYRLIGDGAVASGGGSEDVMPTADAVMVGRDAELEALHAALARAIAGTRQVVFVVGEAGIGKTTLLDRFVAEVERRRLARVARGQCLEQYGEEEPYLPVLEALGGLAQAGDGGDLADVLRRHAPTWLSHLPALEATPEPQSRDGDAGAAMPARMVREMADALDVLARDEALVVVLEDLHWSDRSTVDLIGCVGRRRPPARLLVVGSVRPAQATFHRHPVLAVKQELQAGGLASELPLELLSLADVNAYLDARFGAVPAHHMRRLASRLHERTDGNPLFLVDVVNDLVLHGLLVRRPGGWRVAGSIDQATNRIPAGLHKLLEHRMHRLTPDVRRTLEAASVAGDEFTIASVAGALEEDPQAVEDICETLASQRVLVAEAGVAEWPDGSLTGRFRFLHALYRRVLYDGIAESRRARLHRAIGLCEERGFGRAAAERASQLAMHFANGRDYARALHYHEVAGAAALERHAPHEASSHFRAALEALARLPEEGDRAQRELRLVVANATLLMAVKGYAAPETERAFARARALCDASQAGPALFGVVRGLVSYHHVRAELADALDLGSQLLARAADRPRDRALGVQAHYGQGATLFHAGRFPDARHHLEAALADYDPAAHREHVLAYGGYDPGVASSMWLAWTLAFLGRLEEAASRSRDGIALAERIADPFSLAWARHAEGVTHQIFGDWPASEASSAEAARLAEEHGFPYVFGMATVNRGWALVMQGKPAAGIPILRDGVAAVDATGAGLMRPSYLGMLAAADAIEGDRASAARRLDAALGEVERTGERLHEAGLLVAKGHLLAVGGAAGEPSEAMAAEAERCLRRALDVARAQNAGLFELRAAVALARHCRKQGRPADGRAPLAAAHAAFASSNPAAHEVAVARALLKELGARPRAAAGRRAVRGARSSVAGAESLTTENGS